MAPKETPTIMPDYGGAWGWILRDEPDTSVTTVGGNNADVAQGFLHETIRLSPELESDFAEWQLVFNRYDGPQEEFDWGTFHERGGELARRFRGEVGDAAVVRYAKPVEDPDFRMDEVVIIE